MRKMKLLLALFALFMGTTASWAQGWTSSEVGAGEFYLLNVGGNGFLVGANDWGTRASIDATGGIPVTLAGSGATYTISTSPTYDGKYLGVDGFVDQGSADWVFEAVEGESNVYKMKCGNNYLYADAVADAGVSAKTTTLGTDPGTNMAYWKLISKDNLFADFEGASETSPVWATCLIKNPGFGRRINKDDENAGKGWGWTVDASNKNMSGGQDKNRCAEHWQSAFTVKQIITDLPNGKYGLRIQAAITEYNVTGADIAVAYIKSGSNESTAPFNSMIHGENNMDKLSDNFSNGEYFTNYMVVTVTNGQIEIGVRGTRTDTWCVYDNFQLSYLGEDLAAYVEAYHNALDAAKAVNQSARMSATILSALQTAISNYGSVSETDKNALLAAANALDTATANANTSIASYAIIASGTVSTSSLDGWTCTNNNTFHINTWSVEGNSDGSNMTTPFIENWVGAGSKDNPNYLGAGTFSYTLEGLEPGEVYYAQALIRSYSELGNTPNGPNFFINDVETNLSTEGTECTSGNAKGRYATMGAAATVGADGKITLGAVIAADANYNWVAFKNVSIQSMDDAFNAAVEKVKALEGKVPTSVYNRAYAVVTEYTTNKPTTAEGYETAIAAIEAAATAASAYVEPYAAWTAAKNKAETNYASVTLVTTVKEAQTTVVEEATEVSEVTNATTELNNAIASYDKWVAYKDETVAAFGSDLGVAAPTTVAECATAIQNLNIAQYNKVATDYTFSCSGLIGDFGSWTGTATVAGEAAEPNYLDYEHWSGEIHAYYEQAASGWGNTAGWTIQYQKTCTLPAGDYVIKVAARSSAGTTSSVSCTATNAIVTLPNVGSPGRGIATNGVASWSDDDTFVIGNNIETDPAVGGQGLGWQWRFLPFTLTEQKEVTMTIYAEASTQHQWMSIADGELLSKTKVAEDVAYNEANTNTIENKLIADVTMDRTIKVGYNTVVLPFTLTANQVAAAYGAGTEVYNYSENSEDSEDVTINFTKGDGSITANVPVLVKATLASTSQIFEGVQISVATDEVKVAGTNFDFVGTYEPITVAEGDYFIGNGAIYKSAGTTNMKAFRAYIGVKTAGARVAHFFIDGNETTGIEGLEIVNSNNNGKIYNLNGQQVKTTQKGLYIMNGKKVVVK